MKKKNAVMIADTRPALIGHLLLQIVETNSHLFDEAIIYYDEISDKDKEIMSKIMPCNFIKYDYNFPDSITKLSSFKKFSNLMFSRYEMFSLLKKYKTITWIDTDVLVMDKLDTIIEKANKYGMVANFENKTDKSYKFTDKVKTSFKHHYQTSIYNLDKYNMSSGLISVSDILLGRENFTEWCYNKTIELAEDLILPDQAILNLFIQEFDIEVEPAGEKGAYCVYPYKSRDTSHAKIIHSWGTRKFWSNWYLYLKYPLWKEIYNKWLKMGGSDFLKSEIIPAVSILIPTYKPNLEYLKECLDSLLKKQVDNHGFDFDNFELLLISEPFNTEEIKKLLDQYDDPRINFIVNPERFGIAKTLNEGLKKAKAPYIARMDDDDTCYSQRIYLQWEYLNTHEKVQLVTSNYEYYGDMEEKRLSLSGNMAKAWSIFTCPFDHPSIMFKKNFFVDNNLYYDETRGYVEDWELWLRAFDKGLVVGSINKILFYHRWHNGQASQNNKSTKMMYELIQKNFLRLNVFIEDDDLKFIGPWQGIVNGEQYIKLEHYFKEALENNKKLKIYDDTSLKLILNMRLEEAKTGKLKSLIIEDTVETQKNIIKSIIKKILYPFYRPLKDRIIAISSNRVEELEEKINELKEEIDNLKSKIE